MSARTAEVTDQEARVTGMLADVWNAFLDLPVEHSDDTDSFRKGIHDLQGLVLKRAGRRALNAAIAQSGVKAAKP